MKKLILFIFLFITIFFIYENFKRFMAKHRFVIACYKYGQNIFPSDYGCYIEKR